MTVTFAVNKCRRTADSRVPVKYFAETQFAQDGRFTVERIDEILRSMRIRQPSIFPIDNGDDRTASGECNP